MSFRLVDAANTHNPALVVLREMGFALGIYEPTYDEGETRSEDDFGHYYARKGDNEFVAGDPLSLLGLVSIWQQRGEQWRRDDDPFIIMELYEEAWPD